MGKIPEKSAILYNVPPEVVHRAVLNYFLQIVSLLEGHQLVIEALESTRAYLDPENQPCQHTAGEVLQKIEAALAAIEV